MEILNNVTALVAQVNKPKPKKRSKVTIIIPAYNEEKTIKKIIEKVIKSDVLGLKKEIIVVDDGSTDNTSEIIDNIAKTFGQVKVLHKPNGGKGSAIRTGINFATGSIIIPQDADLELSPDNYAQLIKPILERKAQVVFGDRCWQSSKIPFHSKCANFIVTFLANFLYGSHIKDEACGYKVMSRSLYQSLNLQSNGFEICPETLSKVRKLGYKIKNVPVHFAPRKFNDGKKINFKDGLRAIYLLIKYRLTI